MPGLIAPLPDFVGGGEHAIHRAHGAEVLLLLKQRGMDFRRRLIDEPLAVQRVENDLAFADGQGARRGGTRHGQRRRWRGPPMPSDDGRERPALWHSADVSPVVVTASMAIISRFRRCRGASGGSPESRQLFFGA